MEEYEIIGERHEDSAANAPFGSGLSQEWYDEHSRRGLWAMIAVGIVTGMCFFMFSHQREMTAFLKSLRWDTNPDLNYAEQLDATGALIGGSWLLALLVAGIFFIRWLHHLHLGLRRQEEVPWGKQQAIWSWIIPILNLFRPVQIVRRSLRAMVPKASQIGTDAIVIFWWICWLASNGIFNLSNRTSNQFDLNPDLEDLISSSVMDQFGTALLIASGLLGIWMIQQLRRHVTPQFIQTSA